MSHTTHVTHIAVKSSTADYATNVRVVKYEDMQTIYTKRVVYTDLPPVGKVRTYAHRDGTKAALWILSLSMFLVFTTLVSVGIDATMAFVALVLSHADPKDPHA